MSTEGKKNKQNADKSNSDRRENHSIFSTVEKYLEKRYDFRYNEIANRIEFKKKSETFYAEFNDNDLYIELQKDGIRISMQNLAALFRSSWVVAHNPFEEYFKKLPEWDSTNQSEIDKLCSFIKAKDQSRFNLHFKKMLVRVIACALDCHVCNKQAFILISQAQNTGKSTLCRWLCPDQLSEYIADGIDTTNKDGEIALCENLFINLDELATIERAGINKLKSLLSAVFAKLRKPFDKKVTKGIRRASFLGSTNDIEYLTDPTGSVRWLNFEITEIDFKYSSEVNKESLWSEAFSLYKSGFKYELTKEEIKENEKANETHHLNTHEIDLIQKYFQAATEEDHDAFLTSTEIELYILEKIGRSIKLNPIGIGKALKKLDFPRSQKMIAEHGQQRKGYYVKYVN